MPERLHWLNAAIVECAELAPVQNGTVRDVDDLCRIVPGNVDICDAGLIVGISRCEENADTVLKKQGHGVASATFDIFSDFPRFVYQSVFRPGHCEILSNLCFRY